MTINVVIQGAEIILSTDDGKSITTNEEHLEIAARMLVEMGEGFSSVDVFIKYMKLKII